MEILRWIVLLNNTLSIGFEIYEHKIDCAVAWFVATMWFCLYWYSDKHPKKQVINIFIEKDDEEEETNEEDNTPQD